MKKIKVDGYNVEIHDFGYASYFYPCFNGNSEFKVSKKGFNRLRHYLRFMTWMMKSCPVYS